MDALETANRFAALEANHTATVGAYIGRTIKNGGQTWTLDGVNYAGVLYWRKGKGKKLFVVGGYTVADLSKLF